MITLTLTALAWIFGAIIGYAKGHDDARVQADVNYIRRELRRISEMEES